MRRWLATKGARVALYPDLNTTDAELRKLFREADFRRALSVAIDRDDINNTIFYGVGGAVATTRCCPNSPLFKEEYQTKWTQYDPDLANQLLDGLGLTKRDADDIRLLPDGRPLQIVVETAGEETEQTDVLELIRDHWKKVGVSLFIKPSQREVFYNRINSGDDADGGLVGSRERHAEASNEPGRVRAASPRSVPVAGLGPVGADQRPDGRGARSGRAVKELMALKDEWGKAADSTERREAVWHKILSLWTDQVFTIGIVSGVEQLVVVSNKLQNVPERGIYNFDPGAYFGMYRPDTFWFAE